MRVTVIGAGPSGSYAAYLSHQRGHSVDVYEKATRVILINLIILIPAFWVKTEITFMTVI